MRSRGGRPRSRAPRARSRPETPSRPSCARSAPGCRPSAASVITVAAIWIVIRRNRPARKRAWLLFGAGTFLWGAGDAYWDAYRFILHAQAPYPSPADVLYQAAYPLLIWGVLSMTGGWARPKLRGALDGAIFAVSAAILVWIFLIEPSLPQ